MSTASGAMVRVDFHGDTLDAIQDDGGKVWVSLRRCCENLGIAYDTQLRKLKSKAWAVVTQKVTTGSDGKRYKMAMIDLDSVPLWLAGIEDRKVKEEVREKLARYQRECARVLADHFFGRKAAGHETAHILDVLGKFATAVDRMNERVAQLESRSASFGTHALAVGSAPYHPGQINTVASRLQELHPNWKTTGRQRNAICKRAVRLVFRKLHEVVYPVDISLNFTARQLIYLDQAITEVLKEAIRNCEAEDLGLFADVE